MPTLSAKELQHQYDLKLLEFKNLKMHAKQHQLKINENETKFSDDQFYIQAQNEILKELITENERLNEQKQQIQEQNEQLELQFQYEANEKELASLQFKQQNEMNQMNNSIQNEQNTLRRLKTELELCQEEVKILETQKQIVQRRLEQKSNFLNFITGQPTEQTKTAELHQVSYLDEEPDEMIEAM
ncbi:Hypothetical_protein [Hexamita inflata]|uniref:Hypothetical_protein n=1 Tax=Hexamita inflata TaxID=28002 RepID=A0AA86P505_9EUKA|nr:Hypothetical protein HINF_LOCUS19393 [Hexamita inflata]